MTELVVPPFEKTPWPTLGPEVCQFIETYLVFGPGDLRGQRAVLDDEQRALLYRMYEIHPKGAPREGKRRFQRVTLSLRKGLRKTELAAWIAAVELHREGPVRFDGWRKDGGQLVPIGRPVTDPYIPMLAYTEDQSEELGYGALYAILSDSNCGVVDDFDIGLQRIMRKAGDGKAVALANAPDQADGQRTTFQHKDETHRWVLPRHKETDRVTRANLLKRPTADPWELETTTMYAPGEGSVAEGSHDYARGVASGEIANPRLFYFHRQASDKHDLTTRPGRLAAIREASGIAAAWSDIEGIEGQWSDPDADVPWLMRAWLNLPVRPGDKAFDMARWAELTERAYTPKPRAEITLGFDGSKFWDSTAIVATEISTGYQWVVAQWSRPEGAVTWEVDSGDVSTAIDRAFKDYNVWRLYADPAKWEDHVATWVGRYGDERVIEWWTNRPTFMSRALRAYVNAIASGDLKHADDPIFAQHVGNAYRKELPLVDDDGSRMWVIVKERPDSPHKIDIAMAACLSWEARREAITDGALRGTRRGGWAFVAG
jgi:phage terminase large subunit-like protein